MSDRPRFFCWVRDEFGRLRPERWHAVPMTSNLRPIYPAVFLELAPENMDKTLNELAEMYPVNR